MRVGSKCALVALVLASSGSAFAQPAPTDPAPEPAPAPAAPSADAGPADEKPPEPAEQKKTPPPAPPPSAFAGESVPPVSASLAPGKPVSIGDRDESPAPRAKGPPESTLGIQFDGGYAGRLGDSSSAYAFDQKQSGGLMFGPGVWLSPSRLWSVGVAYRHYDLGLDSSGSDTPLEAARSLDLMWLGGRAYPFRNDNMGVYLMLGLGFGWQHASGTGVLPSPDGVRPPSAYSCSASDGPGLALGGGLGLDIDLDEHFAFFTQLDTIAHRQSGDVIGDCVPGTGSVTTVGGSMGIGYRFGLGEL